MADQDLTSEWLMTVVIDGPAVGRTYPLLDISAMLIDTAAILRNATLNAIEPLAEENGYFEVDLRGTFPRYGSYKQDIGISIVQFAQNTIVPWMSKIPLEQIVKRMNDALELADHIRKVFRREKAPRVERANKEIAVLASKDQPALEVSRPALDSLGPAFSILAHLDPERCSSIEVQTSDGSQIKVKYEARERMSPAEFRELAALAKRLKREAKHGGFIELAETPPAVARLSTRDQHTLSGTIRELDFDSRSGHFHTKGDHAVPEGTYPFELTGDQPLTSVRDLMGEGTVVMVCLIERRRKKVVRLYAESIHRASLAN